MLIKIPFHFSSCAHKEMLGMVCARTQWERELERSHAENRVLPTRRAPSIMEMSEAQGGV